jgi:hypothetical protein
MAASLPFGCAPRQSAPAPLPAPPVPVATVASSPGVIVSPPQASAAVPAELPEGPDPTAVDTLVWASVNDAPRMAPVLRTYWLGAGAATYQVKGQVDEVLIAQAGQVWRWVVREYVHKIVCQEADLRERLGATSTSLGLGLEPVGAPGGVDVIPGDTKPFQCYSLQSPAITLDGSVGSYLLIRDYRELYSGGAHGITFQSFRVHDLATGKEWKDWSREVTVSTTAIEHLKETLGQPPGPRGTNTTDPHVELRPSSLRSSYGPDGSLSLHVCFTVGETNIPELTPRLSHGEAELGDCISAPAPPRFAADAAAPAAVARFARRQHLTIGGWSRLSGGKPLPSAVQVLFAAKK